MRNDARLFGPLAGIKPLVGNTPLIKIEYRLKGMPGEIFAKAENLNLSGSIKDRMAFHILKKAYQNNQIRPGDRIVEATSGNTGISFAAIGRALGHPVTIFMPDWLSTERINLIKSMGAEIHLISEAEGGFLGTIAMAEKMASENPDIFLPHQFSNNDNCEAHFENTGPEILQQLKVRGLTPHAFVAGVGTGGTIMGVGRYLREIDPGIKIFPLEPSNSPTLSTGCKVGKHRIQGISDEFIPQIVDLNFLDRVISVDDGDSIIMAQKLASQLGLGVGISSGANLLGAILLREEMGPGKVVTTVFPDDNKKYLTTNLLDREPVKQGFLSSNIELTGYYAYKRACTICCDPEDCTEYEYLNQPGTEGPCCIAARRINNPGRTV